MGNQNRYLLIYIFILCVIVAGVVQLAQAEEQDSSEYESTNIELEQAVLDQMLAPIALYPDTLLSHILVASTYPLEVVQAARWRKANDNIDAQGALDYAETQDWDPSVQALIPFTDLLQTMSNDLQWLQQLGDAFLFSEEQVLASIQSLRQKAYAHGNLNENEYLNVEQQDNQIVIQPVQKEVVYVPYYDTRVVYGNWWWHNRQPYRWHRPLHSVFVAGLYWSAGFHIRPSFYFGGFQWRKRHIFIDYSYRRNSGKYWSHHKTNAKTIKIRKSQRWSHDQKHRRGVQYHVNGQRVKYVSKGQSVLTKDQSNLRNNKKRVLKYDTQNTKLNSQRVKNALNTKGSEQKRNKQATRNNYENQNRKSNVNKANTKQQRDYKKQSTVDNRSSKGQQSGNKKQSQTAKYQRQSQAKATKQNQKAKTVKHSSKQTYRGNNSQSKKQSFSSQNKARNTNRQSSNQHKH
ncbi:DUF3300 domain-containing protein [Paraglaciecola sp. 2405UD69-4]|uniref:DUF3300 domain-containing protein n=1 Tax=Paraglaciecola sp. 2405UD69-4 TaxID=3391836 RepID=UPI0039C9309A